VSLVTVESCFMGLFYRVITVSVDQYTTNDRFARRYSIFIRYILKISQQVYALSFKPQSRALLWCSYLSLRAAVKSAFRQCSNSPNYTYWLYTNIEQVPHPCQWMRKLVAISQSIDFQHRRPPSSSATRRKHQNKTTHPSMFQHDCPGLLLANTNKCVIIDIRHLIRWHVYKQYPVFGSSVLALQAPNNFFIQEQIPSS
jgi:hypothetical protein